MTLKDLVYKVTLNVTITLWDNFGNVIGEGNPQQIIDYQSDYLSKEVRSISVEDGHRMFITLRG